MITLIDCYKGAAIGDHVVFPVDPSQMLAQVRAGLVGIGFLSADTAAVAYRFVAMQSDTSALQDALVSVETESLIPVSGVLRNGSVLVCTNVLAQHQPDLVGEVTNSFVNGNVSVQIHLNSSDPDAVAANRAANATQLLMLHKVKLTNNARGGYDNVCVCVDRSVVTFYLTSWGAAGFQYYVAPDAGEPIVNADLNICYGSNPNHSGTAWIARYSAHPSTIQIQGTASLGIPGSETGRYQKVVFKTRSIRSYTQNGQVYHSDQLPPSSILSGFQLLSAGVIDTVPGGSITSGTVTSGPQSGQQFGQPIYDIVTDDWSSALGEVVVFFFVFPDWSIANTVIRGINAGTPAPILM